MLISKEDLVALHEIYKCSFYILTPTQIRICRVWYNRNWVEIVYMLDFWLEGKGGEG